MKKSFRFVLIVLVIAVAFGLGACANEEGAAEPTPEITEYPVVTMVVKDYGTIKMKLYPNKAPQTVYNFVYLIKQGFYDGLTFHRIMTGFMVQGGDPDGNGTGGPGYSIKGEFSKNNFASNDMSHLRGVVSMARNGDPYYDSAGSQFFIMHKDNTGLDGAYAAFGKVTEGMEVVDEIAKVPVKDNNGTLADSSQAPVIEKMTVETFGVEYPEPKKLSE